MSLTNPFFVLPKSMKFNELQFIINTSEITAGTKGASLGPDAIITAARKQENYLFGKYPIERLKNVNHLLDSPTRFPFAKRIDGLLEIYEELNTKVSKTLKENKFPLILAADHGSAGGTIAGIKTAFPDKKLGVIWIDAHADLHSPYTTPSGNLHGMPLATAINEDNLSCRSNELVEETLQYWEKLKNIGGICPKISTDSLIFVGVRDTESQEDTLIKRFNITNHKVSDVTSKGEKEIAQQILQQLSDCEVIYISFDVDSMDPDLTSHGTGTPVKNGFTPKQAENLMLELLESPKIVCLEIVEVNPCLDEKINTMAEVTFEILNSLVNKITA